MRTLGIAGIVLGIGMSLSSAAFAESKPIEQLPKDLARWSTMWVEIPEQMMQVGREDGPVAALTMGPTQGTAKFLQSTGEEVWKAVKPDHRPGHQPGEDTPQGAILRYEF